MYQRIKCMAAVLVISRCMSKDPGTLCDVHTGWTDFSPRRKKKKKREKVDDDTRFN